MRTGGHVVIECLEALGAEVAFGLPGIHALPMWEGLRTSRIRALNFRTELNAGFAADGYARVSGRVAPLLLSTGPGALNALTALMEAAASYVPVVAISSQIPGALMGRRRGFLHELNDQIASFRPIVKWAATVQRADQLPELLAEAWSLALTPPTGPTYLEVPYDVLQGAAGVSRPDNLAARPGAPAPADTNLVEQAAALLRDAHRPVIWAGGGLLRSRAWDQLRQLAELLDAPVATTYMGKGGFPENHPLSVGSSPDERAYQELLTDADVVLCVGTELGAETTGQYALQFKGRVIQIDADPLKLGATYTVLGLVGDAKVTLEKLLETLGSMRPHPALPRRGRDNSTERGRDNSTERGMEEAGSVRAKRIRERISSGLDQQDRKLERGMLDTIRRALPPQGVTAWDMTILGYWAAAQFPTLAPGTFLYPLGSGTLGYAWPGALGAKAALGKVPVLAVVGDGGFLYGASELLTARQHRLDAKLLLIDDGGYGILREYQKDAFGETQAVDLVQPDFPALCAACGVPARVTSERGLEDDLGWALATDGPAVVIYRGLLKAAQPTR
jgi:acetolactate synthase I/II/III large subunit